MKFSEQWLREWVNPDLSTQELVDQLTMAGLEVEGFEPVAGSFAGIIVAEVIAVEAHPNADKLHVCKVSTGGSELLQVVCGAPNARVGLKAPFAPVGARIEDVKIKKTKLRQVESFGMLCSERELGISDHHEGLMELPADAPVGASIVDYLQLNDVVIDLDLTPNRSDCLGITGLAREVGVLNNIDVKVREIKPVAATIENTFPVRLSATSGCPRYVGRVITNINLNAATPLWMQEKLRRCELRSIDPIVDVSNYVMLELGQPMHAFDLDRLQGRIDVRLAAQGESIKLLNDQEIALKENTLLITDDSGPIAIAGIMGGMDTAVAEGSCTIFLESAFFSPMVMAGQARSYGLTTDASHRFERGVDYGIQVKAIERATELILEIAGGEAGPLVETLSEEDLPNQNRVKLRSARINRLLGIHVSDPEVDEMLTRLGFEHEKSEQDGEICWLVHAPTHRFDIELEVDLIEEISRIYGYNNLPVTVPRSDLNMAHVAETEVTLSKIRDQLVSRGYQEAITYSFVDAGAQSLLDPVNEPIALANPISADMSVMRSTLWPGLVKALIYNKNRQQDRIRLFETGLRFIQPANQAEIDLKQIKQEKVLAGVAMGRRLPESWSEAAEQVDFFDVKGDLESIFALTGDSDSFRFQPVDHPVLHPGQAAEISRNGEKLGYLGLLHPRVQAQLGLDEPVFLFELVVALLISGKLPDQQELSKFPEIRRDIAILVDQDIHADQILANIRENAGDYLQNLMLFDVYTGKGIDPTRKSLALGLTYQHPSRTLTDLEVSDSIDRVVTSLHDQFGASLRN
ncbi:MAG: phenylalanine--tRNA ligase subunit beta [Gammaproteobacteria bacterium]|nr:phenylalanine--tRNA ligase subunit beta [Gammaproteobacteria bacterium]